MSQSRPFTPALAATADLPPLLTAARIADLLDVTTRTWQRWVRGGLVHPGVLIGKRRRWPREVIIALVRGETTTP